MHRFFIISLESALNLLLLDSVIKHALSHLLTKIKNKIPFITIKKRKQSRATFLGLFSPYCNFANVFCKFRVFFFVLGLETQSAYCRNQLALLCHPVTRKLAIFYRKVTENVFLRIVESFVACKVFA